MSFPRHIILSRKGFDQGTGGCPSPIYPDKTMLSLPIPEKGLPPEKAKSFMQFSELGRQGLRTVPQSRICGAGVRPLSSDPVHLDPDIRAELRPRDASPFGRDLHLFGQSHQAQSHLANRCVSVGDLFLFFGLFQDAEDGSESLKFQRGAHKKHVLWGWLEVGAVYDLQDGVIPKDLKNAKHHPHLQYIERTNNHVYSAVPRLSFAPNLAGAGIFDQYNDGLCLSMHGQRLCSYWNLPGFLRDSNASFLHLERWRIDGDSIVGRSPGRGQEFVMDTDGIERPMKRWLTSIFKHAR